MILQGLLDRAGRECGCSMYQRSLFGKVPKDPGVTRRLVGGPSYRLQPANVRERVRSAGGRRATGNLCRESRSRQPTGCDGVLAPRSWDRLIKCNPTPSIQLPGTALTQGRRKAGRYGSSIPRNKTVSLRPVRGRATTIHHRLVVSDGPEGRRSRCNGGAVSSPTAPDKRSGLLGSWRGKRKK